MNQNPFDAFDPAYMASLNNAFRAAQANVSGPPRLPDGKYQCIISTFTLKPNKKYQDELSLCLGFEVIYGDQKGITVYKFYNIVPERLDILKGDMLTLGIDLNNDIKLLGELSTAKKILDQIVDITIRQKKRDDGKGTFQNIYINRSHGKADGSQFQQIDDDEVPFD